MDLRRPALIATLIAVPVTVLAVFVFAAAFGPGVETSNTLQGRTGNSLPALSASAPRPPSYLTASCALVLQQMPVSLGKLSPRVVHTRPESPFVTAWGDPAVVLSCGVAKPATLRPGSTERLFSAGSADGPFFLVERGDNGNRYVIIDRSPYVAIDVPASYPAGPIIAALVTAVRRALPKAVCSTDPATPNVDDLCSRRK